MLTTDMQPGAAYLVNSGRPRGRAVFQRMAEGSARVAMMTFPDTGSPERLQPVQLGRIAARWDDPKLVEIRSQVGHLTEQAARVRRALQTLGLDVNAPGNHRRITDPRPEANIGPAMGRWEVTIALDAFSAKVVPELDRAAVAKAAAERRAAVKRAQRRSKP